jgi:pilus assembly protein Flp/PilA
MVTALTQLANSTTTMWGNVSTKVSAATAGV